MVAYQTAVDKSQDSSSQLSGEHQEDEDDVLRCVRYEGGEGVSGDWVDM